MRKLSWIGSLLAIQTPRRALRAKVCQRLSRCKPARPVSVARFLADETNRVIRHRVRSKTK